ncbi:glucooligosaccharide oxidase [Lentinula raphanica]|nr:glucooligosaccharide oxidase [Lentinula raphanica]
MLPKTLCSLTLACTIVSITICSAQNASELKGQLALQGIPALIQGDSGYTAASQPYNLRYTVEPIAIAYPTTSEQISTVVIVGASQKLNVVARSGGHSYIANGLGGTNGSLVVDLSQMKNITVNPVTGHAMIEPGNRLGDVALALNDAGRGLPHGRCTYVGIGGHSGFGGWGFASRMWGMTLDNIISATVVLSNGSIVTASEVLNLSQFLKAIRGSSASFGIVSSLEFRTHPVPSSATAYNFTWQMDIPTASAAFSAFQSWGLNGSSVPPEFGGEIKFLKGQAYGQVELSFFGNYFGPDAKFNETIAPFFERLPTPDFANVTQGTWIEALAAIAVGNLNTSTHLDSNDTFYAKSLMAPEDVPLTNESMTALVIYLAEFWHVEVELYGGSRSVINQVGLNNTAFTHRNTLFTFQPYTSSPNLLPPYPKNGFSFVDGMVESLISGMPNDWQWSAYPNYVDDRLPDWRRRYYGAHYDRLRVLKAELDPTDMFRFPTSIEE